MEYQHWIMSFNWEIHIENHVNVCELLTPAPHERKTAKVGVNYKDSDDAND
jgi:hypothetical protein